MVEKRDVVFDEPDQVTTDASGCISFNLLDKESKEDEVTHEDEDDSISDEINEDRQSECYESAEVLEPLEYFSNDDDEKAVVGPGRPKIIRTGKPGRPKKVYNVLNAMNCGDSVDVPQNVSEAMNSNQSKHWLDAMNKEYNSLNANKTWSLTELPDGQKSCWL